MSTLPGLASKGEKGKSKFQSLDINNLYRVTLGESSEKQQQKTTHTHKHGMQILGKVPGTRRPPLNLPSIKSEHSGTDAAVSLVPSNGPGWGKQETATSSTTTSNSNVSVTNSTGSQLSSHQAAIALPVTTTIPPPNKGHPISATPATGDKSWSAVMSGNDPASHPPPYQSPQFQHEFPSLSAGDGGPIRSGTDTQYGPGPSLRPQTEGSWIQGGSRGAQEGTVRNNSGPLNVPPQLSAQVDQNFPPQYRGLVPQFMCRGNNSFPTNGHGTPPLPTQTPPAPIPTSGNRNRTEARSQRSTELEEISLRPIIKEEELSGMDNLSGDMGWALHDDIDYNQKLAFSDDESKPDKETRKPITRIQKEHEKTDVHTQEMEHKSWTNRTSQSSLQQSSRNRQEEDEIIAQRLKHKQVVVSAVERAKQRKEEEEKKYRESKQAAQKKLQALDEKISKNKRDKENDETSGTINPSSVPPQSIAPSPILLPEWERDRDTRSKPPTLPATESEEKTKTTHREGNQSDFRQLTQIEGRSTFPRKDIRSGADKDQNTGPSFSRQFQSNLPPRFQKQQQLNANSGGAQNSISFQYDNRWSQSGNKTSPNNRNKRMDLDDKDRDEDRYRRHGSDDSYRSHRSYTEGRKSSDNRYDDYDFKKEKEDEKRDRNRDRQEIKTDSFDNLSRQNSDEWHSDRRIESSRYDRPQRPDSRDSRTSRESRHSGDSARHSEPREYIGSWSEGHYEDTYEEKKREHRMQVPGPITKEKIEADDLRNEKRNLTQLKRGGFSEKKIEKRDEKTPEKEDDPWNIRRNKDVGENRAWIDAIPASGTTALSENIKFNEGGEKKKSLENLKGIEEEEEKSEKNQEEKRGGGHMSNRGRPDSQSNRNNPGWSSGGGGGTVYRSSWSKNVSNRGGSRGGQRGPNSKNNEWHGTESEGSADDNSVSINEISSSRSPKPLKKLEKDEKNKEVKNEKMGGAPGERKGGDKNSRDFVPRGEPSRHGRGGGSGFRGVGRGGKRMDGYGPPPVKSPFSHTEEKDKKNENENVDQMEDKNKLNQLKPDTERKIDDRHKNRKNDTRRNKPKGEGDISDTSDDACKDKRGKIKPITRQTSLQGNPNRRGGNSSHPSSRLGNEKRNFSAPSRNELPNRQNSTGSLRSSQIKEKETKDKDLNPPVTGPAINDTKTKDESENQEGEIDGSLQSDSDGFQEVKSKKMGKSDRKIEEKLKIQTIKPEKDDKKERKTPKGMQQLSQQQIANIPSLMATPINPPVNIPQPQSKASFERPRQNKLPPRLVKQRENNRLQKAQMQQGICEVGDMNKVNQVYGMKDGSGVVQNTMGSNAWDKPLTTQLRGSMDQDGMLGVSLDSCKTIDQSQVHCQNNNSSNEEKTVLDGTKPLNTIIFENTNYKSAPVNRNRSDKTRPGKIEDGMDTNVLQNYTKPIGDLLNKTEKQTDMQMQLGFVKEDSADIKLDFFENEISHLTDDKTSKNIGLPRTMHAITSSNNTISPSTADALNIKIQSVKKVWETMPTVLEHNNVGQDDGTAFASTFGPDPNSLDASAFNKGADTPDDNHEVYSPSPNNQNASNSTTNVCKVKPTQQVAGSTGQTVLSTGSHQQHSAMVGPGLMNHPLSPPPLPPVIGANVGIGQPPQPYTPNQHIGYQANLGGNTQYGMSAIPSPPTVLFNSTQQLPTQAGLYSTFPLDQSQVMNNQGRSQYSQYSYSLGQTASSPYSTSMYLQTAQPHAPPAAQAPPDLYQPLSNYRLPGTAAFGQNQQLNNPTTVLISSTSNSLMSATVKPSNQQISAIGTKAGGVGAAYQQTSQQGQQLYMTYDPTLQANYLQNTGVMQRGPGGPVQNNVVPALQPSTLQPSSSYYSGSTGGQTGYFQQPGNSTLQSAQMQQHQGGYGLQGSVFGTHNQSHASGGMQNYASPFLSNPMQIAAAAAMGQQYRSASLQNAAYMKGVGNQQMTDQTGRSQQLKSPGSQQEVLSSVFNSGPQIPSPKSRQTCKQPPQQASPTQKYLYGNVSSQQSAQTCYPKPIQRPVVNYPPSLGSVQQNNNSKHRTNNSNNRAASKQYYVGHGGNLNTQNEKNDDSKLGESVVNASNTNSATSSITSKTTVAPVNQSSEKGDAGKEDSSAISKD